MSQSEIIRKNAKVLLCQVRGKSKKERRAIYAALQLGPIGLPLMVLGAMGVAALLKRGEAPK